MTSLLPLIITRPDPGGSQSAATARALGLEVHHLPLFAARALDWTPPDAGRFDGLLITSAQAVRLGGEGLAQLSSLPVYAVGEASAAAARQAGFTIAMTGSHGAQRLLDVMDDGARARRILWLCGQDRSSVDDRGLKVDAVPCYAVDPVDPPLAWHALTARPAVLTAYSARSARRIADLAGPNRATLRLAAISETVARAAGEGWERCIAASQPDEATLLALAHSLCHKRQ